MELWREWMRLVNTLRPAFSRQRTFYWMILILAGFTIKTDFSGVTSLARGVGLLPGYYTCMLNLFVSDALKLIKLQEYWVKLVLEKFTTAVRINGRYVIIGDGIKVGKEGRKIPGVKSLYQNSQSNTKAEYIMGHSIQIVSFLVRGLSSFFSVPLSGQIHEGYRFNCKDTRTQLDKMFELLIGLKISNPFYFVADRYYCSGRLIKQLVRGGIELITRMKTRAVAYHLPSKNKTKKSGRPRKYGEKIKLVDLFNNISRFIEAPLPGAANVIIKYYSIQLLWRPLGALVNIVLTIHPTKGKAIFLSSDLTLAPLQIIELYNMRFKIEVMFKTAVHQVGTFMYHFWLKCMRPTKRGDGEWLLHFADADFKKKVSDKLYSFHLFLMLGFIAQGLMQYLSIHCSKLVINNFGTWLRTMRSNICPSEKVVGMAMAQSYSRFLADSVQSSIFAKFLGKRIALGRFNVKLPDKDIAA